MFGIFKSNRIKKMRSNLTNSSWLTNKYRELLQKSNDNEHFRKFECEYAFVGFEMSRHNNIVYELRVKKNNRQIKFIKSCIRRVNPSYYNKFIDKISEEEMVAIKRDSKLKKLLK